MVDPGQDPIDLFALGRRNSLGLLQRCPRQSILTHVEIGQGHADKGIGVVRIQGNGALEVLDPGPVLLAQELDAAEAGVPEAIAALNRLGVSVPATDLLHTEHEHLDEMRSAELKHALLLGLFEGPVTFGDGDHRSALAEFRDFGLISRLRACRREMEKRDKEMIPKVLVYAMFGIAFASLAITTFAVVTDQPLAVDNPLLREIRAAMGQAVENGRITPHERGAMLTAYEESLRGYTYFEQAN